MSERHSIIGFTEAELGFFLALLCLVLFVAGTAGRAAAEADERASASAAADEPPPGVLVPPDSLMRLAAEIALLRARIDTLTATIDTLQGRRSRIAPACVERGVATGPLFEVVALGGGRFRLGADTVSLDEVLMRTSAPRAAAERAGCVHQVRVGYLASLGAAEYDAGRRALGQHFRLLASGAAAP
jgi:hypothetical protein